MADDKKTDSGSIWPKLIAFLITTGVGLFTVVFTYWKMKKQGEELAKLQHEKDTAEEEKRQAVAAAATAKNDEEAKALAADIEQRRLVIADLNYKAEKIVADQKAAKEKIDAAKDWSDLDNLVSNSK